MGKLTIKGYAEREVKCDAVELTIKFYIKAKNSSEAMGKVISQSEEFLNVITSWGVDIKNIHIEKDSIDQEYDENVLSVIAYREFKIRLDFNMPFINGLMDLIRDKGFDVDFDCDFKVSDQKTLHDELVKEALLNSKEKAESIASTMGSKITGVDKLEYRQYDDLYCLYECEHFLCETHKTKKISDNLQSPLTKFSESIEVVWIME